MPAAHTIVDSYGIIFVTRAEFGKCLKRNVDQKSEPKQYIPSKYLSDFIFDLKSIMDKDVAIQSDLQECIG